ncbi:MAG: DNA polymerase III subunit delta [Melioribacter sp.]|uniref:DNA polymerase III subunit delta n=1 Tax=Rosettibacter primus TaxID=3111523 RepID=UPI00247E35F6|nr:DNA polymerase III subunit delta [Melioribacter sp.]
MAKKILPSINELIKELKKKNLLPVYFICGEDNYNINYSVELIINSAKQFVKSDFDIEIIDAERGQNFSQIIDMALAFPFGGGKKIIVVKNFDKLNDKKLLSDYLVSPAEFTILILVQNSKVSDLSKEPFASLIEKGFLFEIKTESGDELVDWLERKAEEYKIKLTRENIYNILEIVGEDKSLLESQLQKISIYLLDKEKVTFEEIKKLISSTKQYSIFDLQEAIGRGDKVKAIEVAYNLLDSGQEIIVIINMLAKFVLTVSQILEMIKTNVNDNEAARKLQLSWYYYINCKKANFLFSDSRLLNASRALFEADLSVKTTAIDPKTVLITLISKMMQ